MVHTPTLCHCHLSNPLSGTNDIHRHARQFKKVVFIAGSGWSDDLTLLDNEEVLEEHEEVEGDDAIESDTGTTDENSNPSVQVSSVQL